MRMLAAQAKSTPSRNVYRIGSLPFRNFRWFQVFHFFFQLCHFFLQRVHAFFLGKDMAHKAVDANASRGGRIRSIPLVSGIMRASAKNTPVLRRNRKKREGKSIISPRLMSISFDVYIVPCLFFIIAQKAGDVFALGKNISYNSLTA